MYATRSDVIGCTTEPLISTAAAAAVGGPAGPATLSITFDSGAETHPARIGSS